MGTHNVFIPSQGLIYYDEPTNANCIARAKVSHTVFLGLRARGLVIDQHQARLFVKNFPRTTLYERNSIAGVKIYDWRKCSLQYVLDQTWLRFGFNLIEADDIKQSGVLATLNSETAFAVPGGEIVIFAKKDGGMINARFTRTGDYFAHRRCFAVKAPLPRTGEVALRLIREAEEKDGQFRLNQGASLAPWNGFY